ncbi:MAG: hypothetical protein K0R82_251 [Flavipsychrobacter sp.]|jgi:DNA topoisomerase IA|nr:hypothetical protein [Flavipsychrobacter sp.]
MDSSFVVVAKTVMENRQMLAALTYALSIANPELFAVYEDKLAEIKKNHEKDFELMDSVLRKLNEKGKEE